MLTIDLKDKVVLVTGGRKGIGKATVNVFLEAGATVVSADVAYQEDSLIQEKENLYTNYLDISSEKSVQTIVDQITNQFHTIDILVNCAGISTMDYVINSQTVDWEKTLDINAKGTYLISKAVGKKMSEANIEGRIINMASQAGKNGYTAMGAYVASKHAVIGLTKTLAKELAPKNILVNAVCPGIVETDMKQRERIDGGKIRGITPEEIFQEDNAQIPLGRTADPREVANVILFLATPLASYLTGQAINVTGGMTMN